MKQTRPTCPQGPDVKKEHNAEVPKTMAGQFFRIVQVVAPGAAPSFVLLPTALVRTVDTTQTLPETVRPIRLQGPDNAVDTKTVDRTQKVTDAEVTKTVDGTQKLSDAGVTKTVDGTQKLTDAGVTKTVDRTQKLTDAGVTKTDDRTQKLPDAGVDRTQNSTDAGVDRTQNSTDAGVDKTVDGTQTLTDAGVDKTDDTTQNSTGKSCKMLARFGGKRRPKNTCTSPVKNNISLFPALKDYLPASCNNTSYDYHVCHYQTISETSDHINFKATLRMALSSEDEIKRWLKSHTVTWRVERSRKSKGDRVLFKVDYRCQHNTKHNPKPENIALGGRNTTSKNTNCPAKMTVTILRTRTIVSRGRPSISSDPHVPAFPTMVSICSEHNHNINGTDALRYRDVGDKAREKLLKLFEAGHNPSAALEVLKIDLQVEHGDNYAAAVENKELCPTLEFCYRLRHKLFGKLRSTHRRGSSLPGSQKKRRKKKACPDVQQCVTAEKEQTDNLMQGQSSQQNPSQGDPGTNQEECEAESAADCLCLSVSSDYEEDTEDLVETMIRDLSSLRKDPMYSQAVAAMAKQFHHIRSNRSRLLSAMHCFGKGQTSSIRTATRRPDALSPCQPTVTPRPVTKLSSKRRLPSGPQQTHSSPIKRPRMMDYHI